MSYDNEYGEALKAGLYDAKAKRWKHGLIQCETHGYYPMNADGECVMCTYYKAKREKQAKINAILDEVRNW